MTTEQLMQIKSYLIQQYKVLGDLINLELELGKNEKDKNSYQETEVKTNVSEPRGEQIE